MTDLTTPPAQEPVASDFQEEIRQLTEGLDERQLARLMETIRAAAVALPVEADADQKNIFEPNWHNKLKSELAAASRQIRDSAKIDPFSVSSIALSAAAIVLIGFAIKVAMTGSTGSLSGTMKNLLSGSSGAGFAAAGILTLCILWLRSKVKGASQNIDLTLARTVDLLNSIDPPKDGDKH